MHDDVEEENDDNDDDDNDDDEDDDDDDNDDDDDEDSLSEVVSLLFLNLSVSSCDSSSHLSFTYSVLAGMVYFWPTSTGHSILSLP